MYLGAELRMMNMNIKALVASLMLLTSAPSLARTIEGCSVPVSDENVTRIYFANGVGNSFQDAMASTELLKEAYVDGITLDTNNDERFEFAAAYNESRGKFIDILEVFQQKMTEEGIVNGNPSLLYQLIIDGYPVEIINQYFPSLTADKISDFVELVTFLWGNALMVQKDIPIVELRHVSFYTSDLVAGKQVFIVAHSQGNLFTNSAIEAVLEQNPEYASSIRKFGVATPAARLVNGKTKWGGDPVDDYVTADDDRVIANILDALVPVLPATIDNDASTIIQPGLDKREFTNHSFGSSYFAEGLLSRRIMDSEIERILNEMNYPEQRAGEGAIRVSLTWGRQLDVDLHVFEPDGTHVFYDNKIGTSGRLDVDDFLYWGPENYVVECDRVVEGTYKIAVNYFRNIGNFESEAIVTLFTGDGRSYGPKQILLPRPQGKRGDDNPTPVYEILVSDDGDGNAQYDVKQDSLEKPNSQSDGDEASQAKNGDVIDYPADNFLKPDDKR
jgi:hypothetical protein